MATRKSPAPTKSAKPPARNAKKATPAATRKAARSAPAARKAAAKKAAAKTAAPKKAAARRPKVARALPETLRLRGFSPGLTVGDLEKSIAFYTEALGFVVDQRWMREGQLVGVMLKAGACELGLSRDDWAKGRDRAKGEGLRIWAETRQDVDQLAGRARSRGARITDEPGDKPWGARAFSFDDPDGFHWTISSERGG